MVFQKHTETELRNHIKRKKKNGGVDNQSGFAEHTIITSKWYNKLKKTGKSFESEQILKETKKHNIRRK